MTPTPPSTTSSSTGGPSPDANQFKVTRKRNRVPLSCAPCRHRKLKCNRSHPCENCVRRGDAASCSYASPGARKKSQTQASNSPDDMQNRIDRLEGLVLSLMTNGTQSVGPTAANAALSRSQSDSITSSVPPRQDSYDDDNMIKEETEDESEVEGVTNSLGVMKVDESQGKAMYIGESHWHLVLADIAEVKNYFMSHKKDIDKQYEKFRLAKPSNIPDGPAFLFSSHEKASDVELRSELPSKSVVEKLVTRFFNSHDPAVHIIHSPTFRQELQKHWQDPAKTSIVWLGLLYSMMCLAMQSYHKAGDEPVEWNGRTIDLANEYRLRTVQCLVNSDYTKSSIYTIETFVLYVNGETAVDADVGIWVIVGTIMRLAMRMGYHRDGSNYGLTPPQGEMRRRVWATIRQMDIMCSFQLALPSMVRDSDCDNPLPRNIFDDEFRQDSKSLPPSRPSSEPTPIAYMIAQAEITFEFGSIVDKMGSVSKAVTYDEVLKHDAHLRELKNNSPPHLRIRPMEECKHDPATLLMQRYQLDILWHKTMVVLHRKYIGHTRQSSRYAHSRRSCVDSSMELLRLQAKILEESQPGGRLRPLAGMINCMPKADYLLGAVVVCLDLNSDSITRTMASPPPEFDPEFWTTLERADMLRALEHSLSLWKADMDTSMEAFKAAKILSIMLEKLRHTKAAPSEQQTSNREGPLQGPTTAEMFAQFDEQKPEHSAAMTLGMLSGGLTPNTAAFLNSLGPSPGGGRYGTVDMNMTDPSSTGMTPNYGMDMSNPFANLGNNAASPFAMFNNMGNDGMLDSSVNLDWGAWDQYMQNGSAIDPNFQFYPTNLDPNLEQNPQPRQQQQQQNGSAQNSGYENSVFMGASGTTPGS